MKKQEAVLSLCIIMGAIMGALPGSARAQEADTLCNPAGTQAEMSQCEADRLATAETEAQKAYDLLAKALTEYTPDTEGLGEVLENAHSAWSRALLHECRLRNVSMAGGSMGAHLELSCQADAYTERARLYKTLGAELTE